MKPVTLLGSALLFAAFGYIGAYQKNNEWVILGMAAALGVVAIALLQWLLVALNPVAKEKSGLVHAALQEGLLFLLPFAALALVADAAMGWQSANAFFSAGLSSLAITSGGVLIKNGGRKWSALYVPLVWAMAVTTGWILLLALYS